MTAPETPLASSRRRDVNRRRQRVHQVIASMRADGSEIIVSAVAARGCGAARATQPAGPRPGRRPGRLPGSAPPH